MGIYDEKMDAIIEKYGFKYEGQPDSTAVHNIVMRLFQDRCLGRRVALWGAGRSNSLTSHASVIIGKYASCMRGLVCLVDSAKELQGTEFMHYPVIAPQEIKNKDIELIIVASRSSAGSIRESIQKYAPWCEVLDIYQELKERGIVVSYNFYEGHSLYVELYDIRKEYEKENNSMAKAEALHKLISAYLSIRDIPYALDFCDEYINRQYKGFQIVKDMENEIQCLVQEIREQNIIRKRDIIIHFIDALRAMDITGKRDGELEFYHLKEYFQDMLYFENAYSTAPVTYESVRSIICGQYPYDVNVYNNNFIYKFEEFPLLQDVKDMGYGINFYTSDEWRVMHEDSRINYTDQIHMPQKLWKMVCDRAENSRPFFAFLYYPWELHFPLVCGFHKDKPHLPGFVDVGIVDMSGYIVQQFNDCLAYMDKEFGFYRQFYNEETYLNIFSDHSQIVYDEKNFMPYYMYYNNKERATHCIMAAGGPGIEKGVFKDNFSMIDYNKVMRQFISGNGMDIASREVIRWQYYSIHNKRFRDVAEERGYTDYIDGIDCYMADGLIYSKTANGKEEVYQDGDMVDNIASTTKGKQFIAYIKEKFGEPVFPEFLDIHFVS